MEHKYFFKTEQEEEEFWAEVWEDYLDALEDQGLEPDPFVPSAKFLNMRIE